MKKSKVSKGTYKLTKTLPPIDRFKLVIESIKKQEEEQGTYDKRKLPNICLIFETTDEYEDYIKIVLDFIVVNEAIRHMLGAIYGEIIFLLTESSIKEIEEKDFFILIQKKIIDFNSINEEVKKLNQKYDIDLFTSKKLLDFKIEHVDSMEKGLRPIIEEILSKKEKEELSNYKKLKFKENTASLLLEVLHKLVSKCIRSS
ncbi:hypothetical protein ACFL21_01475 [Patescibacteria group bacterium]